MNSYPKIYLITIILLFATASTLHAAQVLFTPTLMLSEAYTSNAELDTDGEVEQYTTTIGLSLKGEILARTAGLELYYNPSYSDYRDVDDNDTDDEVYDSWRQEAGLLLWKDIKRNTRMSLSNTYLRTSSPVDESVEIAPDDPTQGPVIGSDPNRRGRSEYSTNTAEARFSHQFGSDDSFYMAYQYYILRDEDEPSAGETLADNDILTPSAGLTYNFSAKWGMEIGASYAITDYKEEIRIDRDEFNGNIRFLHNFNRTSSVFIAYNQTILNFDQETSEDYQIYRPSIGVEYNFKDNAGIIIGAGYYIQDFDTSKNEEGFNVDSNIFKRWEYGSGYVGIKGSSGYEIDDNGSEDNGLTIYYEGHFEAGYRFTTKVSSRIHGSYRYSEFPNETPEREDSIYGAGVGLDWQTLKWMAIGLSYNYSEVVSDDPTNEYTENRAMITIRMSPTSPYRLNK